MITKGCTYGENNDVTLLQFGRGDIMISGIITNERVFGLSFSEVDPLRQIDWRNRILNPKTTDELENVVVFEFSEIKSVENLINTLNYVKQEMIKYKKHEIKSNKMFDEEGV
ncbi:hypothetical protein PF672P2_00037 [Parabacteroides phage PF672P2]|nr:hypothetical protein PF672P2_00037 [Parabacteroides phage PF672P2]